MPITISGNGTISGLSVGGLTDFTIQPTDLAFKTITNVQQVVVDVPLAYANVVPNYVDLAGMAVSITPSNQNSKILVMASLNTGTQTNGFGLINRTIFGGSSTGVDLGLGTATRVSGDVSQLTSFADLYSYGNWYGSRGFCFLDSPQTTAACTYKIRISTWNATYPVYVNVSYQNAITNGYVTRNASTLTVMEVTQ